MVRDKFQRHFRYLLKQEDLSNVEQFLGHSTFEEIPLFSRNKEIHFLADLSPLERSSLLLQFAYRHGQELWGQIFPLASPEFFLMLSVLGWPEYLAGEQIYPNFWVTDHRSAILPHLRLSPATSSNSNVARKMLGCDAKCALILESSRASGDINTSRVYIVPEYMTERVILADDEFR